MPAILRNFRYQTDASPSVIGSTESYGQLGHRGQDVSGRRLATLYPTVGSNSICGTAN